MKPKKKRKPTKQEMAAAEKTFKLRLELATPKIADRTSETFLLICGSRTPRVYCLGGSIE